MGTTIMDHCTLRKVYGRCTAQDLEILVSVKPANITGGNSSHVSSSESQWTQLSACPALQQG